MCNPCFPRSHLPTGIECHNIQAMSFSRGFLTEKVILISCLVLILTAVVFVLTQGLMDSDGYLVSQYNSTGSDDDVCIECAILIFGWLIAVVPWSPGRIRLVVFKTILFSMCWIIQMIMLGWIEAGDISATILDRGNAALVCFLTAYIISLPLIWIALFCDIVTERTTKNQKGTMSF